MIKMIMKRCIVWKAITMACVLSIFLIPCSSAHSGRTDSNGGHTDHSTGEYHYHHGFPAHQHTNGVCPYSFVDKTGSSSGSGGGKSSSSSGSSHASNSSEPSSAKDIDFPLPITIVLIVFLSIPCLSILFGIVWSIKDGIIQIKNKKEAQKRYLAEKEKYELLYGGKSIEEIVSIPKDVEIGSDGLPKLRGVHGWGKPFTFYRSSTGSVYHCKYACSKGAVHKIHACQVWFLRPCKRCKPTLPDLKWYQEYCKIKAIKEKYKIP